ncbi:hypothetical protein [Amycolatopsis sp. NPDC057786]|uniref:hypothetical protein n=1 Tax=Amycolatopsis sp. NPDC057786 TaxID=3346250 RepID=UPI003672C374
MSRSSRTSSRGDVMPSSSPVSTPSRAAKWRIASPEGVRAPVSTDETYAAV